MMWPVYENKAGFPSTKPIGEMIRAMSGHVAVNLAVQDAADEAAARDILTASGVPLDHVHFFHIEHGDIWARDTGPQFTRSRSGQLRVNDWNFNYWGNEEPDSDFSTFDEPFDRTAAQAIGVPVLDARGGPETGVRFIHEGGSATHNGQGTMIVVESVVMQRNLGPNRFCGGQAPVTDGPPAQHLRAEPRLAGLPEARRARVPEDAGGEEADLGAHGGHRGHRDLPRRPGQAHPGAGAGTASPSPTRVSTPCSPPTDTRTSSFASSSPDTVLLARGGGGPRVPANTPAERLLRWLQEQNRERLQRVYEISSGNATTESGDPIRIVRINTRP